MRDEKRKAQEFKYTKNTFFTSPVNRNSYKQPQFEFKDKILNQHFAESNKINQRKQNQGIVSIVDISPSHFLDVLEIYDWRNQTDYPIIWSHWRKVIFNNKQIVLTKQELRKYIESNAAPASVKIEVETEEVVPLESFGPLSVAQILYAFKEALVAFERLFSLFGPYLINSKMITVNQEGKVKIWISSQYNQNIKLAYELRDNENSQSQIIKDLKIIFMCYMQDTPTSRQFLKGIQGLRSIVQLLKFLEEFAQLKKIIISTRIIQKSNINIKRPSSPNSKIRPGSRAPAFVSPLKNVLSHPFIKFTPPSRPQLALVSRKSVKQERYRYETMETRETFESQESKLSTDQNLLFQVNSMGGKYGKIVKNKFNNWLANCKSLQKNCPDDMVPSIQKRIQVNSIQRNMNRLLNEDSQEKSIIKKTNKFQSRLMQLGRSVRESFHR